MSNHNPEVTPTEHLGAVEALCILVRLADGVATLEELATRLGLSKCLTGPLGHAVAGLARCGYIGNEADGFRLTDSGRLLLRSTFTP